MVRWWKKLLALLLISSCQGDTVYDCGPNDKLEKEKCLPCPKCPVGSGLAERCGFGAGSFLKCEPCNNGHYNSNHEDHVCIPCTNCTMYRRLQKYSCRREVDAECGSCMPGFFDNQRDLLHTDELYGCVPCSLETDDEQCDTWRETYTPGLSYNNDTDIPLPLWKPVSLTLGVSVIVMIIVVLAVWRRHKRRPRLRSTRNCRCLAVLCNVWESCCRKQSQLSRNTDSSHDEEGLCSGQEGKADVICMKDVEKAVESPRRPDENQGIDAPHVAERLVTCGLVEVENTNPTESGMKSLEHKTKAIPGAMGLMKNTFPGKSDGKIPETTDTCSTSVLSERSLCPAIVHVHQSVESLDHDDHAQEFSLFDTNESVHTDDSSFHASSEASTLLIRGQDGPDGTTEDEVGDVCQVVLPLDSHNTVPMLSRFLSTIPEDTEQTNSLSTLSDNASATTTDAKSSQRQHRNPLSKRPLHDLTNDLNANTKMKRNKNLLPPAPTIRNITHNSTQSVSFLGRHDTASQPSIHLRSIPEVPDVAISQTERPTQMQSRGISSVGNPTSIVLNDGGISIHVINHYPQPEKDTTTTTHDSPETDQSTSDEDLDPDQTDVKTPLEIPSVNQRRCNLTGATDHCRQSDLMHDRSLPSWHYPVQETCDGPIFSLPRLK